MKSYMESVRVKDVWQCLLKNKQTKKPHKNPLKHPEEKDQALTCVKVKTDQSQGCEVRDLGSLLHPYSNLYILCSKPGGDKTILFKMHNLDNLRSIHTI